MLFAPLMNEGEAVGIITVTRGAPGPFGEQHVQLLQMFADQAVIAIENVRLFNEVRQGSATWKRWSSRPRPPTCCR